MWRWIAATAVLGAMAEGNRTPTMDSLVEGVPLVISTAQPASYNINCTGISAGDTLQDNAESLSMDFVVETGWLQASDFRVVQWGPTWALVSLLYPDETLQYNTQSNTVQFVLRDSAGLSVTRPLTVTLDIQSPQVVLSVSDSAVSNVGEFDLLLNFSEPVSGATSPVELVSARYAQQPRSVSSVWANVPAYVLPSGVPDVTIADGVMAADSRQMSVHVSVKAPFDSYIEVWMQVPAGTFVDATQDPQMTPSNRIMLILDNIAPPPPRLYSPVGSITNQDAFAIILEAGELLRGAEMPSVVGDLQWAGMPAVPQPSVNETIGEYRFVFTQLQGEGSTTVSFPALSDIAGNAVATAVSVTIQRDITAPLAVFSELVGKPEEDNVIVHIRFSEVVKSLDLLDVAVNSGPLASIVHRPEATDDPLHFTFQISSMILPASQTDVVKEYNVSVALKAGSIEDLAGNVGPPTDATISFTRTIVPTPSPTAKAPVSRTGVVEEARADDTAFIVIGVLAVVSVVIAVLIFWLCCRRRSEEAAMEEAAEQFRHHSEQIFAQYGGSATTSIGFDEIYAWQIKHNYSKKQAKKGARGLLESVGCAESGRMTITEFERWLRKVVCKGKRPTPKHVQELLANFDPDGEGEPFVRKTGDPRAERSSGAEITPPQGDPVTLRFLSED